MEIKSESNVPYIVYEGELSRAERYAKRLWIALIIAIIAIIMTNCAWLAYESSFETISYVQDGNGVNNVNIGKQGDIIGTESTNQKSEGTHYQKSESTQTKSS